MLSSDKRWTIVMEIECIESNPNGDPDAGNDPRRHGDYGVISGPSVRAKIRALVDQKEGAAWKECLDNILAYRRSKASDMSLTWEEEQIEDINKRYNIYEKHHADPETFRKESDTYTQEEFFAKYWDARVFGAMHLVTTGGGSSKKAGATHKKTSAHVCFDWAKSIAPICIHRDTTTNQKGVQDGKDQGMAPRARRVVLHGVYHMVARYTPQGKDSVGLTDEDLIVLETVLPYTFTHTRSSNRANVDFLHIHVIQYTGPNKAPEKAVENILKPTFTCTDDVIYSDQASLADYIVPTIDAIDNLSTEAKSYIEYTKDLIIS